MHHTLSRLLSGGIVLGLLGFASTATAAPTKDRALLIGIGTYQNPQYSFKRPEAPLNDVQEMSKTLVEDLHFPSQGIKTLLNEQATKTAILDNIEQWLVEGAGENGRRLLYYSGHGHCIKDQSHDEKDGWDETLAPYDTDLSADDGNMVLDDDIEKYLNQLRARNAEVIAIFDSCHSGTVTRGMDDDSAKSIPNQECDELNTDHQKEGSFIHGGKGITAFFAAAPNQRAFVDDRPPAHSVFTQALIQGIKGEADENHDRIITYSEILAFTQKQSAAYCQDVKSQKCKTLGLTPLLEIAPEKLALDIRTFFNPESAAPAPTAPAALADSLFNRPGPAHLSITIKSGPPTGTAMTPGTTFQPGQRLSYEITSDRSGKLVLFDIDAKGEVTQLFPNGYVAGEAHRPEWINAHDPVKIPGHFNFKLRVKPDLGPGKLIAVLIEDASIDTGKLTAIPTGQPFPTITDPARWLPEFRALLNQLYHAKDGSNRAIEWSMTAVDYHVEAKAP